MYESTYESTRESMCESMYKSNLSHVRFVTSDNINYAIANQVNATARLFLRCDNIDNNEVLIDIINDNIDIINC